MPSAPLLRTFLLSALASLAYKAVISVWLPSAEVSSLQDGIKRRRQTLVVPSIISVNGSLPLLPTRHNDFSKAFAEALATVLHEAEDEVDRQLDPDLRKRMRGVPGTSITSDEEAQRLQKYLDCVSGQGRWVRDERGAAIKRAVGGVTVHKQSSTFAACDKRFYQNHAAATEWDVREDLKWTWEPNQACDSLLPPELLLTWQAQPDQISDLPSRRSLCQLLRHKNILLVGDAASQYPIHDLILDWTSDKPLTCYGDLFCNEHGICGGRLAEGAKGDDDWDHDDTVNDRLPTPPSPKDSRLLLKLPEPKPHEPGEQTYGTIVRYRRSDGFYMRTSPSMPGHDAHFAHPATGIREINNYAVADARRSDVVLINKPPLPMPLLHSYYGNWTARLDALPPPEKPIFALRLALAMTIDTWLIDVLDSLAELRDEPSPADQLVMYRSSWRTAASCGGQGNAPLPESPLTLEEFLHTTGFESHTMLHDFQVVLQNYLLRQIVLPLFGIPYLDLETPLSIWQSGFVSGKAPHNCLQPCIPSPGMAMERALIGGMWKVMAWGWTKDEDSIAQWMGDDYTPLRIRLRRARQAQAASRHNH